MRNPYILICIVVFVINSCNSLPDKPVSEKLNKEELSKAMKSDTAFSNFYEEISKKVDNLDDIQKAKYNDVSYRRLFSYYKFLRDTTYWNPLRQKWNRDWNNKYGIYLSKADSTLNYWRKYLSDHSLNSYVKIELDRIDKEYYEYIGDIKEVNLGF